MKLEKLEFSFKINTNCITIGEYCAHTIVFRAGKLSGVSRNGPLVVL